MNTPATLEQIAREKRKPSAKHLALLAISDSDRARFLTKITRRPHPKGCWEWLGAKTAKGYGMFKLPGACVRAHRLSFSIHKGVPPAHLVVCHSCDNPSCVNPDHLWLGTNEDNTKDCQRKGRIHGQNWTHCYRGHEFTPENTGHSPEGRYCLTCHRMMKQARKEKQRAAMRPEPERGQGGAG